MMPVEPLVATWCLVVIQVLGLACAAFARLGEGSVHQTALQRLFVMSMVLVGLSTVAATLVGPVACLVSGTTLAMMMLAATYDSGAARRASTW